MPRDEYLIQTFDKGIISSADQSDIAEGAAAWSIDEDPESIPGTVQPRMTDTVYTEHTSQFCIEKHSWITKEDGKHDLVFYNAKGGTVDAVTDFDSAKTYAVVDSNAIGTSKTIAMTTINRAVRIGQGNAASKYVGYIDQGQFGNSAPTALQYDNAELISPSSFPSPYKTIADATYVYGIEWQGTKILKITVADGTVTKSSGTFNSLQGICDIDATYFYLFDAIGNYGNLYKIAKATLTIDATYHVTGWGALATTMITGGTISDIETTTNKLWFSVWKVGGYNLDLVTTNNVKLVIFNVAIPITANADIIPTDVTFTSDWDIDVISNYVADGLTPLWAEPVKTPFVKLSGTVEIAWLAQLGYLRMKTGVTPLGIEGGPGLVFMDESSVVSALLNSDHTRFRGFVTTTVDYIQGLELIGSDNRDYIFFGADSTTIDIYYSTGSDEFKLSDAIWVADGDNTVFQFYTSVASEAKSTVGDLTNTTISTSDVGGADKDVTVNILSSVSGTGRYLTRVYDTTAFSGSTNTYIGINPITVTITPTANTEGTFDITKEYFYKVAFEYDLYQMSPLSEDASQGHLAQVDDTMDVTVDIYESASISERVTAVLIFRAEANTVDKSYPETLYRLAGRISTKDNWTSDITDDATWGTKKSHSFTDLGSYGPSYETETGCPETLLNNTMNYTISCTGAGYLFVGQGYNNELEKVSNLIFRSKKNAPDTFDWSNDFCVLPTMPIALHYFKGYLYAFDTSKMYVIDPEALVLIGEYNGYGVQSALSVTSDENAMYFANTDNVYIHDGKTPSIISYPINQVGTNIAGATSHRALASIRTIVMNISPKYNSLVIAYMNYGRTSGLLSKGTSYTILTYISDDDFRNLGAATNDSGVVFVSLGDTPTQWEHSSIVVDTYTPMFVYHLTGRKWFYWNNANTAGTYIDYTTADKRSLIVDYLGNIYLSAYKGIAKLCGSTTGATCTWYSKLINFGDNTTLKKIYKVIWDGTCDGYIGYNTPSTITTQLTSGSYINTTKYLTAQLKFSITSGEILRGITLIWRKMVGLR